MRPTCSVISQVTVCFVCKCNGESTNREDDFEAQMSPFDFFRQELLRPFEGNKCYILLLLLSEYLCRCECEPVTDKSVLRTIHHVQVCLVALAAVTTERTASLISSSASSSACPRRRSRRLRRIRVGPRHRQTRRTTHSSRRGTREPHKVRATICESTLQMLVFVTNSNCVAVLRCEGTRRREARHF